MRRVCGKGRISGRIHARQAPAAKKNARGNGEASAEGEWRQLPQADVDCTDAHQGGTFPNPDHRPLVLGARKPDLRQRPTPPPIRHAARRWFRTIRALDGRSRSPVSRSRRRPSHWASDRSMAGSRPDREGAGRDFRAAAPRPPHAAEPGPSHSRGRGRTRPLSLREPTLLANRQAVRAEAVTGSRFTAERTGSLVTLTTSSRGLPGHDDLRDHPRCPFDVARGHSEQHGTPSA